MAYKRQAGYLTYTHHYDEAQRIGEHTLALYRKREDRLGEAQMLRELGFLHWLASDYGQALLYGRQALQLHRVLGDVVAEATALHNLAEIYRGLGSPRQALQLYTQSLDLHWAGKDEQWQGMTLYGMAHALRQVGKIQAAQARYQQALTACTATGDRLMVSRVHQALASVLWECGPSHQVLEHLNQALSISRDIGYGPGIAHGLSALAVFAAQRGERDLARRHFEEASIWLRLTEDQDGLIEVESRLQALTHEPILSSAEAPAMGWVKSHLAPAEGKVYCEFESPLARGKR
jgi:tetratricopeptide (TPR) repeat protein